MLHKKIKKYLHGSIGSTGDSAGNSNDADKGSLSVCASASLNMQKYEIKYIIAVKAYTA